MAKTMAQIGGGVVTNILWCSDGEPETDALVNLADRPVGIGDTYADSKFYRDGAVVLTPLEAAQAEIARLRAEMDDMQSALTTLGVNTDE